MVNVKILFNGERKSVIVPNTYTIRQVLEENGVDYARGVTNLDGASLVGAALDKTFADYGVTSSCMLANVVKTDNA